MPVMDTAHPLRYDPSPGGCLLLAEDSPDLQELLCHHLKGLGIPVLIAHDGREAVELALAEKPALVLMDLQMPHLSGLDAARELRSRGFLAPILALTAHLDGPERAQALAAGCDAVLEKSLSGADLRAVVAQALNVGTRIAEG